MHIFGWAVVQGGRIMLPVTPDENVAKIGWLTLTVGLKIPIDASKFQIDTWWQMHSKRSGAALIEVEVRERYPGVASLRALR
jgi:hypothetical protein